MGRAAIIVTTPTILLVAKGSVADGLGHVIRCASVGVRLSDRGARVRLAVVGDDAAAAMLADSSLKWTVVPTEESLIDLAQAFDPDLVVLDLISLGRNTFDPIRRGRQIAGLSPFFTWQSELDATFSRVRIEEDAALSPSSHQRGLEFCVVRAEVQPVDTSEYVSGLYDGTLSVGVCMGGGDAPNKTLQVLEAVRHAPFPLLLWVMLGEGYSHSYEELVATVRADHRHEIVLAKTGRSMWTVLRRCNVLILAGGTTSYEAVHARIPSINLIEQPRESTLLQPLMEAGAVEALSYGLEWERALVDQLAALEADRDRLFVMHRRSYGLIDEQGADRIAGKLIAMLQRDPVGRD